MSSYKHRTDLSFFLADGTEQMVEAEIRFTVTPGYPQTWEEPGCGPTVEIDGARVYDRGPMQWHDVPGWMLRQFDGDEMLAASLLAEAEAQDEYHRDQAADARRDELRGFS